MHKSKKVSQSYSERISLNFCLFFIRPKPFESAHLCAPFVWVRCVNLSKTHRTEKIEISESWNFNEISFHEFCTTVELALILHAPKLYLQNSGKSLVKKSKLVKIHWVEKMSTFGLKCTSQKKCFNRILGVSHSIFVCFPSNKNQSKALICAHHLAE